MNRQLGDLLRRSSILDCSSTPRLDAELLLAHCLGKTRSYLLAHPEASVPQETTARYMAMMRARQNGIPIAYLKGRQEFWSLELEVDACTLIPRPESELLVERALDMLSPDARQIAELGSGSGAIACALASERRRWRILASDLSPAAVRVARGNAKRLKLTNISFAVANWCLALARARYDAVISNPPYLAVDDPSRCRSTNAEPPLALFAEEQGFAALRLIAQQARVCLKPQGALILEHAPAQSQELAELLKKLGYQAITPLKDLSGNLRAISCRLG